MENLTKQTGNVQNLDAQCGRLSDGFVGPDTLTRGNSRKIPKDAFFEQF